MKSHLRWLGLVLRYGLCVVALVLLARVVPWYDHIRLSDAEHTRVRLIEQDGDRFVVEQDGQQVTLGPDDVEWNEVKGGRVANKELGIASVLKQTDKRLALLALFMFLPVPMLSAFRLIWMLGVQEVRLSVWNSIKLTFAGNFFNFALPGTTGGDLIKAYYVTRFTHHKTEAVTSIFLDRVVGLLSLVLMAGAFIFFTSDPTEFKTLGLVLGAITFCLAIGVIMVFSHRMRRLLQLERIVRLLPMSAQLTRIGRATLAMRRHKPRVLASVGITFLLQGIAISSAVVMAWALQMDGSFQFFFIYIAIGFLIAAVPTTPQAIGVMEWAYVGFFAYGGANDESQALALALSVRLIQLFWSLPGVLVPMLGAHLPTRTELAALEQTDANDVSGFDDATGFDKTTDTQDTTDFDNPPRMASKP